MNNKLPLAMTVALLALAAIAVLWSTGFPGESLLVELAHKDLRIQNQIWTIDVAQVRRAIRLQLAFWSCFAALAASVWSMRGRILGAWRSHVFQGFMTAGCAAALYLLLLRCGREAEWYPIQKLMTNPGSMPVFGHRLLWVWLADAIKLAAPFFSYRQCYYLCQIPPVVLTVWIVGRWSSLFVTREFQWIGQALAVVMLSITFSYFTFYDVAIVFFFTLCLFLLRSQMYVSFVVALAVATLNHENAMLLIPVAALETAWNRRLCVTLCCAATIAHCVVRAALFRLVPLSHHVDWRFWTNLYYPFVNPLAIVLSAAQLLFWWGAALLAWRSADRFLKRAALLFPLLGGATFFVGQFQESRQFDALIPVVIGFILSFQPLQSSLQGVAFVTAKAKPDIAKVSA